MFENLLSNPFIFIYEPVARCQSIWSTPFKQHASIFMLKLFYMMTSSNGNISALLTLCGGIHRWPVNSPHKGQWRGALMFSLICTWINGWVNNREAGDLRHHRTLWRHCNEKALKLSVRESNTPRVLNVNVSAKCVLSPPEHLHTFKKNFHRLKLCTAGLTYQTV